MGGRVATHFFCYRDYADLLLRADDGQQDVGGKKQRCKQRHIAHCRDAAGGGEGDCGHQEQGAAGKQIVLEAEFALYGEHTDAAYQQDTEHY